MQNKFTIGQYINGKSWLHKLDPRIKIASLVFLLVTLFLIPIPKWTQDKDKDIIMMVILGLGFVGSFIMTITAGISLKKVVSGLRGLVFLLTFTFIVQLFTQQEGMLLNGVNGYKMHISITSILAMIMIVVLYNMTKKYIRTRILYFLATVILLFVAQYFLSYVPLTTYQFRIYDVGLIKAAFLFVRIIAVIVYTSLLTFTTSTTDLNFGIESLLRPLKVIFVPVEMIAMMLSLTLRHIPTLLGEADKIMRAQASRGADFNEGKFRDRVLQIISLLIPIFVLSFKRAEDLGNAMETRGYIIGEKRTRIDEYHMRVQDLLVLLISVMLLVALILYKAGVL